MAEYAAVPHTEDDEHLPRRKRRFSPSSLFSRDQLAEFSSAPVAIAAGVLLTAVSIWVLYAIFSGISAHRQTLLGEEINSLVPECTYLTFTHHKFEGSDLRFLLQSQESHESSGTTLRMDQMSTSPRSRRKTASGCSTTGLN